MAPAAWHHTLHDVSSLSLVPYCQVLLITLKRLLCLYHHLIFVRDPSILQLAHQKSQAMSMTAGARASAQAVGVKAGCVCTQLSAKDPVQLCLQPPQRQLSGPAQLEWKALAAIRPEKWHSRHKSPVVHQRPTCSCSTQLICQAAIAVSNNASSPETEQL